MLAAILVNSTKSSHILYFNYVIMIISDVLLVSSYELTPLSQCFQCQRHILGFLDMPFIHLFIFTRFQASIFSYRRYCSIICRMCLSSTKINMVVGTNEIIVYVFIALQQQLFVDSLIRNPERYTIYLAKVCFYS